MPPEKLGPVRRASGVIRSRSVLPAGGGPAGRYVCVASPFGVGSCFPAMKIGGERLPRLAPRACSSPPRRARRRGPVLILSIDGGSCRLNPARRAPPARAARPRGCRTGRRTDKKGSDLPASKAIGPRLLEGMALRQEHSRASFRQRPRSPGGCPRWTGRFAHHRPTLPSGRRAGPLPRPRAASRRLCPFRGSSLHRTGLPPAR